MQCAVILGLVVATLSLSAQERYFPPGALDDDQRSEQLLTDWYSGQLKALEEPSLLKLAANPSVESYRFVWLRTFHHPVAVRLVLRTDGIGELTLKVANGAGGYAPGHLIENVSRPLTRQQTASFLERVKAVQFWELPNHRDRGGNDGAEWIIEGVKDGKYHVVTRWTPKSGPVRELGLMLALGLAQINIPESELY
jgi:hypothetical protein